MPSPAGSTYKRPSSATAFEALPHSTGLDRMPANLSNAILLQLEMQGLALGRIPRFFLERPPGSWAVMGRFRGDREKMRQERERIARYLREFHKLISQLYKDTLLQVTVAKIAADHAIRDLEQGIKNLESHLKDGVHDAEEARAHKSEIRAAKKQKRDLEQFRDEELPQFEQALANPEMPEEKALKTIQQKIEKRRFKNPVFDFAYRMVRKAARNMTRASAELAAAPLASYFNRRMEREQKQKEDMDKRARESADPVVTSAPVYIPRAPVRHKSHKAPQATAEPEKRTEKPAKPEKPEQAANNNPPPEDTGTKPEPEAG